MKISQKRISYRYELFDRLLRFLDLFPAKIEIETDHGTSFKYENMNTSLVNIDFNQWHEGEPDSDWFTIASGNRMIDYYSIKEFSSLFRTCRRKSQ